MRHIEYWAARFRTAAAGLTVLAVSLWSIPGQTESALPVSALTPLVQIGQALESAGIDLALQDAAFSPDAPVPIAVASVPPSIVEGPITTAEREEAAESQTPRLALPDLPEAPSTVVPRRKPPVPVMTAEPSKTTPSTAPASPKTALASTAAAYKKFQTDVTDVARMRLDKAANLNRAVSLLSSYDGNGLSRGWVASGGEIAAASKPFQATVKKMAQRRDGTKRLFGELKSKPNQIHALKGADKAQGDILVSVAEDVAVMRSVAARLLEVAYERTGEEARLASEASNGGLSYASLQAQGMAPSVPARAGGRGWPIMTQMLTAGLHINVEGEAGAPSVDGRSLATNKDSAQCMRWAKLNLDQCLAAARLNTEKAFCLSRHGLEERADCLSVMLN